MRYILIILSLGLFLGVNANNDLDLDKLEEEAVAAYHHGSYALALDLLEEVVNHKMENKEFSGAIRINIFIAEIQRAARSFDMALSTLNDVEVKLGDELLVPEYAYLLNRRAAIYFEKKTGKKAYFLAKKSIRIEKKLSSNERLSSNLSIIGAWLRDNGNIDSAKYYLDLSLTLAKKANNIDDIITSTFNKSWFFYYQKANDSAMYYAFDALKLCKLHKQRNRIYLAHSLLSDVYAEEGDFYKALVHHRAQIGIRDSIITEETQDKFDALAAGYKTRFNIADRHLLEEKNKNKSIIIIFLIALSTLVLLLIVLLFRNNKFYKNLNKRLQLQQKDLDRKNEELEDLNSLKNKLFSVLAHDIRSPLASVEGFLSIIGDDTLDELTRKEMIGKLKKQLNATDDLLSSIVTWAKTQLNGVKIVKVDLDLKELLDFEIEKAIPLAKDKDIEIRNLGDCNRILSTDSGVLSLIIRNLLNNAIKFTKKGGEIKISCTELNGLLKLSIADNGIGMSQNKLESLFTSTSKNTLGTNKEKGFGLGLMLCYDFAKKLNAELVVESELGLGSTFTLVFPV